MAQKTVIVRTDDFDGTELGREEGQTISISLDGAGYEFDLSDATAQQLRDDSESGSIRLARSVADVAVDVLRAATQPAITSLRR